ncbi:MAG: hypothetical protein F2806_05295 [Actinobacteria bacterium]|uniref:Unannotated protein n=1 Tax=freshwater metagenome TaxID=449393 RepID=A0A6J7GDH3_9ZZZZ|nr:hypothetical protein [Actinomycetota bacterium]
MRTTALAIIPILAVSSALALTGCSGSSTTTASSDAGATSASPQASVNRMAAGEDRSIGNVNTVTLVNNLSQPVTVRVDEVDGFDWNGDRPDREAPQGFEQQTINPRGKITRVLGPTNSKWVAGAPFTPVFLDANGKEIARVGLQRVFWFTSHMNPTTGMAEEDRFSAGWSVRGASVIADESCPKTVTSGAATIAITCYDNVGTTVTVSK